MQSFQPSSFPTPAQSLSQTIEKAFNVSDAVLIWETATREAKNDEKKKHLVTQEFARWKQEKVKKDAKYAVTAAIVQRFEQL